MIRYALICDSEHEFEAWFQNSASFDKQVKAKAVSCPACGSTKVSKALMAPAVSGTRKKDAYESEPADSDSGGPGAMPMAAADPKVTEMVETLRQLKKHVVENSEYVGERFPEEARKIHNEESEARSIYGEASLDEAKSLIDEGVELHPLPILPEERN
jgi:hypothetical protein